MSAAKEFFARFNRVIGSSLQKIRPEFLRHVIHQVAGRGDVPEFVKHAATTNHPFDAHLLTPPTSHHPWPNEIYFEPTVDEKVRMPRAALLQFPNEEEFKAETTEEITERLDVDFSFSFGPELAENPVLVSRLCERPKVNVAMF